MKLLVLPEQTEDGAPGGEGDQRQNVTQRVQRLHHHVEDQLERRREQRNRVRPSDTPAGAAVALVGH